MNARKKSKAAIKEETAAQWVRGSRFVVYVALLILGIGWMTAPLIAVNFTSFFTPKWAKAHSPLLFGWGIVAALAYPAFAAFENNRFERWVRKQPEERRAIERAVFKTNTDLARYFWTAVLGIYVAVATVVALLKA